MGRRGMVAGRHGARSVVQTPSQQSVQNQPTPQQAGPQAAPEVPPASSREENPGLINEMGKFLEKSFSILPSLEESGRDPR